MPYFSATYAASVDKIFATLGPYIVKCNATTGERESMTKLASPIYGDMPICYHPGTGYLFVGSGRTPNKQLYGAYYNDPPVFKDLYRVDPSTLAITPCHIELYTPGSFVYPLAPGDGLRGGVYHITPDGAYVHVHFCVEGGGSSWGRINATTLAVNGALVFQWGWEQMCVDATYAYTLDPYQRQVQIYDKTLGGPGAYVSSPYIIPYNPVSLAWSMADSKPWIVCGDENLLRLNSQTDYDFTQYNLLAVPGPATQPDPCRIQCLSDGYLYLPCMTANGVIKWNPLTGTGTWFGGFEGPIDVVETPTKKFVVQNSPVGLKELL